MKVSVIIPCFNEENTIIEVLAKTLSADYAGLEKEIILVNDGSTDSTAAKVSSFLDKVKLISYPENSGKGFAVRKGLEVSSGDLILIQDADLEYDTSDYYKLLSPFYDDKCLVVYGIRDNSKLSIKQKANPLFWGGRLLTKITNLLFDYNLNDIHTGYKIFRKSLLKNYQLTSTGFELCHELTAYFCEKRIHILEVPIKYKPRTRRDGKKITTIDGCKCFLILVKMWINTKLYKKI